MTVGEIIICVIVLTIILTACMFILENKNFPDHSEEEEKELQKMYDEISNERNY